MYTHTQTFYEKRKSIFGTTKTCRRCKNEKDKALFPNERPRLDGKSCYCNECKAAMARDWYQRNKEKVKFRNKEEKEKNPEKWLARERVKNAVRYGKIQKPVNCQGCGTSPKRLEAHHHNGYSKKHVLDVLWLCHPCHEKAHHRDVI